MAGVDRVGEELLTDLPEDVLTRRRGVRYPLVEEIFEVSGVRVGEYATVLDRVEVVGELVDDPVP